MAIIWNEIRNSELYSEYMNTREGSFKDDKELIIQIFKEIIAPNEKLYDYLEDKKLTWVDDLPLVNTAALKFLQKLKESTGREKQIARLFKNDEDGGDYVVVGNRDIGNPREATLTFAAGIKAVRRIDKKTRKWVDLPLSTGEKRAVTVKVDRGDAELLRIIRENSQP